jgi:hypothetical protein
MNELRTFLKTSLGRSCATLLGALCTFGCSSSGKANALLGDDGGLKSSGPGFDQTALDDLNAVHVDKYVGKASLSDTTTNADGDTVYNFDPSGAAVCYLGSQYHVVTHDAGSDNLLIFLQGGGACWEDLCSATDTAGTAVPKTGILNQDSKNNVVGGWNIAYGPYCDGSVFSGDNDMMSPDGKAQWHFHGLANLSALIDAAKKTFPNPKRILLAGSSAGGYGTLVGTGITRLAYPHTPIDVFNDAGLGLSNTMDPGMLDTVKRDWKFDQYIPDSCDECKTGVQTAIIGWGMEHDPSLRGAGFSSYGDAVIGGVFLKLMPPDFKKLLMEETDKVHDKFPTRFERFFITGTQHTVLQSMAGAGVTYDSPVDGVSVEQWLEKMLNHDPGWTDHLQAGD